MITLISNEGNKRGNPNMTVVNEPGLYTLILSSRKPEAKAFKRWITHDVIPMIRKTGGYMTDSLLERIQKEPAVIVEHHAPLDAVGSIAMLYETAGSKSDARWQITAAGLSCFPLSRATGRCMPLVCPAY